ncbi:hypothetical protein ABH19_04665 [Leptospirillum sp. Group II 'CF-1']|nr:hypothetical protein ABH19_04665 [Leptospirillum sp. Group II 'CF-1']
MTEGAKNPRFAKKSREGNRRGGRTGFPGKDISVLSVFRPSTTHSFRTSRETDSEHTQMMPLEALHGGGHNRTVEGDKTSLLPDGESQDRSVIWRGPWVREATATPASRKWTSSGQN